MVFRTNRAFTLAEMLLVVAIVAVLAVTAVAPYAHYSDLAKLRISSEKVEQAFSEARVSAMAGFAVPGSERNADLYVELVRGAKAVRTFAVPASSAFRTSYAASGAIFETPLEASVVLADLPSNAVVVRFSSVTGNAGVFAPDGTPAPSFTGGVVRVGKADDAGAPSKPFRFPTSP